MIFDKVIDKNKLAPFLWLTVHIQPPLPIRAKFGVLVSVISCIRTVIISHAGDSSARSPFHIPAPVGMGVSYVLSIHHRSIDHLPQQLRCSSQSNAATKPSNVESFDLRKIYCRLRHASRSLQLRVNGVQRISFLWEGGGKFNYI